MVAEIGKGLLVLVGVGGEDTQADADYLARKTAELRLFEDDTGKMNRSLIDIAGEALVVSQFTLYGDCRKGRRPSFVAAAAPETAKMLYERYAAQLRQAAIAVRTGIFGAMMAVELLNDGPVTILLDSRKLF